MSQLAQKIADQDRRIAALESDYIEDEATIEIYQDGQVGLLLGVRITATPSTGYLALVGSARVGYTQAG